MRKGQAAVSAKAARKAKRYKEELKRLGMRRVRIKVKITVREEGWINMNGVEKGGRQ